jgi:hypothetical protein
VVGPAAIRHHQPLKTGGERLVLDPQTLVTLPKGTAQSLVVVYAATSELDLDLARLTELRQITGVRAPSDDEKYEAPQALIRHMDALQGHLEPAKEALTP